MSHSKGRIWIHAIWSTKNRIKLITPDIERLLYKLIREQFRKTKCNLRSIGGVEDHVHCLYLQNPCKSISDTIKQVKGATSKLVDDAGIIMDSFYWQTGYAAYSVSEFMVPRLIRYIMNQKEHHKTETLSCEIKRLDRCYSRL
ncbi:MAG: IS200/IS605 family transposase [Ignavibacteria bacterium]|nr:IS200/IS605 family transposase [Ignavibacteria bacterium]